MKTRTYADPNEFFNIKVPSEWRIQEVADKSESDKFDFQVAFYAPVEQECDFRPHCIVQLIKAVSLSFEEYAMLNRLQLRQLSGAKVLTRDESLEIGSHVFEWVNTEDPTKPIWVRNQIFMAEDYAFTVTAGCEERQIDNYSDVIGFIFDSFEVL